MESAITAATRTSHARTARRAIVALAAFFVSVIAAPPAPVAAARAVAVERDVVYALRGDTELALDVWRRPAATARPVVVLVHGGGWQSGSRGEWERIGWARSFAAAGFVTIIPSYRLACTPTEGGSPLCGATMGEQRRDTESAVRWSIANAATYGGDPSRIALVGASAGAHLALLAARAPALAGQVDAVVAISPIVDLESVGSRRQRLAGAVAQAIGCPWLACRARWRSHSPSAAARRAVHAPTYLFASRRDPRARRGDVDAYAASLRRSGTVVALREPGPITSACHGPWACERFSVAGTRQLLRSDVQRWIAAMTAPRRA